jgi:hypothetical protein
VDDFLLILFLRVSGWGFFSMLGWVVGIGLWGFGAACIAIWGGLNFGIVSCSLYLNCI